MSDLHSLDEELFRNLMFLKTFTGNAEDLMLSFSITENVLGVTSEIDLCPNGSNIDVTSSNKLRYVYQMANYRLNVKIKHQCDAFLRGLRDIIPVDWLRMFSERELQWLISGSDQPIDLIDLRQHCQYAGGYNGLSGGIRRFWSVVGTFSANEKRQLLRFVTSCERAPPLGFQALHPPFQIQVSVNSYFSALVNFVILYFTNYCSIKSLFFYLSNHELVKAVMVCTFKRISRKKGTTGTKVSVNSYFISLVNQIELSRSVKSYFMSLVNFDCREVSSHTIFY